MATYLCVVSPRFPENYHIGVRAGKWGVEENYRNRIGVVQPGDELVFISQQRIVSLHRIESKVFREETPLWPKKDGDIFPWRISISPPLFNGAIPKEEFTKRISFMIGMVWGGTIQGASGVFNSRLTPADVTYIKSRLEAKAQPVVKEVPLDVRKPDDAHALFRLLERDVMIDLQHILPSVGLRRHNGHDFPAEYDLGYGGNVILCRDNATNAFVVLDFNRGEAPNETVLRVLHYMSWVRQNLADTKDVRGLILSEKVNESLRSIVSEIPNISLRCYRFGIQLIDEATG